MDPLVIYICDKPGQYQAELDRQLTAKGIKHMDIRISNFSWIARIDKTAEICEQYPDRTIFAVDAWDTMFMGEKFELADSRWEQGITFAAQKRCWPDPIVGFYDVFWEFKPHSRWRYLNSNPMAGLGKNIAEMIRWGQKVCPLQGNASTCLDVSGEVCERFYTNIMIRAGRKFNMKIDTRCELSHTTTDCTAGEIEVSEFRIRNRVTGSLPIFLHLNGSYQFSERLLGA